METHPTTMEYIITGRAAHGRVGNLFQNLLKEEDISCIDKSPYDANTKNEDGAPSFSSNDEQAPISSNDATANNNTDTNDV